jgi:asparagine synthase (glutamine-hydrolysing)
MCGIAGYVTTRPLSNLAEGLRAMSDAVVHRGPDDEGFFEADVAGGNIRVGLAHRRLSIIDLSTGHQPMTNEDGTVQLVFNGEIYNFEELRDSLLQRGHVFRTKSDTETIVHAYEEWGEQCVTKFRGMFAFALWDTRKTRLFIARDRFGKKPLFLHEKDGLLLFASEIKSILAFPGVAAKANESVLWDYFYYRYVPAPHTLFAGIRKLMPGTYLVWSTSGCSEHRYYQPPDAAAPLPAPDSSDIVGAFLRELDTAVRIRMISDVPFGAFLSGGIDSSAVVGLMARHSSLPVKTFSVGFTESNYSELAHAKTIAELFKTDHHELSVSEDHLMEHLPALVRFRDAPVAEPSDIPIYLLAKEARRTVKMVLTGEGSDELLGGYPKHVYERHVRQYQQIPGLLRRRLIEPAVASLPFSFRRIKTAIATLGVEGDVLRQPRWFGPLSVAESRQLLSFGPTADDQSGAYQFQTVGGNSPLRNILYFDQTSWLPDNLLERGDRMTMAASLEARMPFMDHELAAFASGLPEAWRIRGRTTKRVLREAMKRLLPKEILERPKVGFRVPVNQWFRTSMREYLLDHLTAADSRTRHYYRPAQLRRILGEHIDGRQNHEKLLWCMLSLELWHRAFQPTG